MSDDPTNADIAPWSGLITSEHADKPNFMATVATLLQPIADIIDEQCEIDAAFDIDTAVGSQLDVVGLWVGASRCQDIPLTGVYFSWNTPAVGWGQGIWKGEFDPSEGLQCLSDDDYRNYLRATILANHWDGSIPGLYNILNALVGIHFTGLLDDESVQLLDNEGVIIGEVMAVDWLIQDNGDMSFDLVVVGPVNAVSLALITGGYLKIKPAGVRMNVMEASVPPFLFGWNMETGQVAGWGQGSWPAILASL